MSGKSEKGRWDALREKSPGMMRQWDDAGGKLVEANEVARADAGLRHEDRAAAKSARHGKPAATPVAKKR
jgi:hypothetical protein